MHPIRNWFITGLAALALHTTPALAQEPSSPLVTARLFIDNATVEEDADTVSGKHTPDGKYVWAAIAFTIADGWHIYWQNPGDSGIPTTLDWKQLPAGVTAGSIHWPVPHRASMGGLVNYGYEKQVILPVPLALKEGAALTGEVSVKADWLVCKDTCIPESAILTGHLEEKTSEEDLTALDQALEQVPQPSSAAAYVVATDQQVRIAVATQADTHADIFPVTDGWFPNSATATIHRTKGWIGFELPRASGALADRFDAVLRLKHEGITERLQINAKRVDTFPADIPASLFATATEPTGGNGGTGLLTTLFLAFIGGLILNLMPCVLPVLSLKLLSLSRKAEASRAIALTHGLSYTAGVLVSFALIGGLLLALKTGGASVGWGFQLQSPGFVLALTLIVYLVALNLLGLFELPVLFGSRGHDLTSRDSALGSFATGVLAVALATPCTAPFMAPALGAALTLPAAASMLIFLALGFGLALPYLLVSIVPALRRMLPKPGQWMQRFKEFLAFPMFATAAWLLWVLSEQAGGAGLLQALALLLVVALAIWGLKRNHASLWRAFWKVLLAGSILCALINPPQLAIDSPADSEHAVFNSDEIARLRAENKPVFVDATAAWCITCKVNERVALKDARIVSLFEERDITFMVADWTKRDDAITAWLASFGRNGVPLYVYYPPGKDPVILPQILTPDIVAKTITSSH